MVVTILSLVSFSFLSFLKSASFKALQIHKRKLSSGEKKGLDYSPGFLCVFLCGSSILELMINFEQPSNASSI